MRLHYSTLQLKLLTGKVVKRKTQQTPQSTGQNGKQRKSTQIGVDVQATCKYKTH